MRRLIPALAATLLAAPALADQMPNLIPAHDVTGTYIITSQGTPSTVTVQYSKSANALRLDPQTGQGYILYDFGAHDAKMVMPDMQRYMDQPALADRAQALQGSNGDDVTITKGSTETIAGHACTDYTATDKTKGTSSSLCVTDDGVLLKLSSADANAVAQSVSYDDVPEANVQLPAGYTELTMPQMPGMGNMSNMPGMPSIPSVNQ
jgi:hypothetical protein